MSSEEIILFVGALVLGFIKVPFVDWLKSKLGLEGNAALILSYVVAILVAAFALLASGELVGGLTLDNLFEVAAVMIAMAQFAYRVFNPTPQS